MGHIPANEHGRRSGMMAMELVQFSRDHGNN